MARSNRQLTQFAVDKVRQYLTLGPDGFQGRGGWEHPRLLSLRVTSANGKP